MQFNNSVAVVTGGANGIGLASAKAFRDAGAQVVIGDINAEELEQQARVNSMHGVICDVAKDEDIANIKEKAQTLGDVDLVMANAGIAIGGRFEVTPTSEWQRLFDINVMGVVRTINAFLPGMLARGRGHIVITGSSAGLFRSDGMDAPYAASKYALRAMAQGLAVYASKSGVSVHYLAPRITDTAFPKSSTAWGRKGSRITSDRELGSDFDTVEDVANALMKGLNSGQYLISLTPDTDTKLMALARDPLAET